MTHPSVLSDDELLRHVVNDPSATEREKSLAMRLSIALGFIEHVTEFLEEHGMIEAAPADPRQLPLETH